MPTRRIVSQSSMASSLGLVPSRPRPPIESGWSSGVTAFPGRVLTTGAPSNSAAASTSSRAWRAPTPARTTTFFPSFRTLAASWRSSSRGTTRGGLYPGAVAGARAVPRPPSYGLRSAGASCMSTGNVRCETPLRDRAVRTAMSDHIPHPHQNRRVNLPSRPPRKGYAVNSTHAVVKKRE